MITGEGGGGRPNRTCQDPADSTAVTGPMTGASDKQMNVSDLLV